MFLKEKRKERKRMQQQWNAKSKLIRKFFIEIQKKNSYIFSSLFAWTIKYRTNTHTHIEREWVREREKEIIINLKL